MHTCAKESGSAVSSVGSGENFNDFINSKLKCCLHNMNPTDVYTKLDCVDNSIASNNDFNKLWASADEADNGNQMNAIMMVNAAGRKVEGLPAGQDPTAGVRKPISGFYTLEGKYCSEFSEFMAPQSGIQSYAIDPPQTNMQQITVGSTPKPIGNPFPLPPEVILSSLRTKLAAANKRYPTTVADMYRCPVLFRSAISVKCPSNPLPLVLGSKIPTYIDSTRVQDKIRCDSAASIMIHVRLEQVFQITGQPVLKAYDSIVENGQTSSISVQNILKNR
jgi:hypothetical protein